MTRATWAASLCALALVSAKVALAAPTEEASLNTCQNAVKVATTAFVKNKVAAIGTCLQAISTQMVKKDAGNASAAASTCVTQFRKLNDSRHLGKSLPEKLTAGITAKCTPGGSNTHTLGDILGVGARVSQPLNADNLNAWCSNFGGTGSIDTLQDWMDCISAAAECGVDSAIAAQYPRVLDWLNLVKPSMQALTPPPADSSKITDAVAALNAVKAEIDGPNNDNVVSIQCGGTDPLRTGQTQCDQGAGTLGACPGSPAGQDGSVLKGATRSYTDNGDGTITDNKTGLMWEKLSQDGTIHDYGTTYTWHTAFTTKIATLNSGGGFAGYTDWRLPNLNELQSIANYGAFGPAVDAVFNTGCAARCTVSTCSCTQSQAYWSSTSCQDVPYLAWSVGSYDGSVFELDKSFHYYVRAVRGGF